MRVEKFFRVYVADGVNILDDTVYTDFDAMDDVEKYVNGNHPERFVVVYTVLDKGCPETEFAMLTRPWDDEGELGGI